MGAIGSVQLRVGSTGIPRGTSVGIMLEHLERSSWSCLVFTGKKPMSLENGGIDSCGISPPCLFNMIRNLGSFEI